MQTLISKMKPTVMLLVALLVLSGCGQKGALFIPADPDVISDSQDNRETKSQKR